MGTQRIPQSNFVEVLVEGDCLQYAGMLFGVELGNIGIGPLVVVDLAPTDFEPFSVVSSPAWHGVQDLPSVIQVEVRLEGTVSDEVVAIASQFYVIEANTQTQHCSNAMETKPVFPLLGGDLDRYVINVVVLGIYLFNLFFIPENLETIGIERLSMTSAIVKRQSQLTLLVDVILFDVLVVLIFRRSFSDLVMGIEVDLLEGGRVACSIKLAHMGALPPLFIVDGAVSYLQGSFPARQAISENLPPFAQRVPFFEVSVGDQVFLELSPAATDSLKSHVIDGEPLAVRIPLAFELDLIPAFFGGNRNAGFVEIIVIRSECFDDFPIPNNFELTG